MQEILHMCIPSSVTTAKLHTMFVNEQVKTVRFNDPVYYYVVIRKNQIQLSQQSVQNWKLLL